MNEIFEYFEQGIFITDHREVNEVRGSSWFSTRSRPSNFGPLMAQLPVQNNRTVMTKLAAVRRNYTNNLLQ